MGINKILLAGMLVFISIVYSLLIAFPDVISPLTAEDRIVENVGALALFVAGVCFIVAGARPAQAGQPASWMKRLITIGVGVILIFGAGEEISWGQRILNIETPESLQQSNRQNEINLHNLTAVYFGDHDLTRWMFHAFWFGLVVIIPLAYSLGRRWRTDIARFVPVMPWLFALPFVANYIVWRLIFIVSNEGYGNPLAELQEMIYGVLFALMGIIVLRQIAKGTIQRSKNIRPDLILH